MKRLDEEAPFRSRFQYRKDAKYVWNTRPAISYLRCCKLWEKGIITNEMLFLMQGMADLTVLSGKHVESLFWLETSPADYKRIRLQNGKNPYRNLIRQMVELGLLIEGRLEREEKITGSRIYSSTSGAIQFAKEKRVPDERCFVQNLKSSCDMNVRRGTKLSYACMLSLMALNQMHFHALNTFPNVFDEYGRAWVAPEIPVNLYQTKDGWLQIWAPRVESFTSQVCSVSIEKLFAQHLQLKLCKNSPRMIILLDGMDAIFACYRCLPENLKSNVRFTTDQEVFEGYALQRLIQVTGEQSYQFVSGII